jgi:hypothetical protein
LRSVLPVVVVFPGGVWVISSYDDGGVEGERRGKIEWMMPRLRGTKYKVEGT